MSGPSRLASSESTLVSLEERVRLQEKRIEELERENAALIRSRREIYEEVKSLHKGHISLRERNLKLSREMARLSKENISLEKKLAPLESTEDWNSVKEELLLQRKILFNRILPSIKNSLPRFERTCPMCEYRFSSNTTSQMEFEAHVIKHFPCDEEDLYETSSNSFSS